MILPAPTKRKQKNACNPRKEEKKQGPFGNTRALGKIETAKIQMAPKGFLRKIAFAGNFPDVTAEKFYDFAKCSICDTISAVFLSATI